MNAEVAITPSIISSLAKALAEIEGVQKNKANPGLKGARYADLSAVIDAIEPIKSHGLWYRQVPKRDADGALVETFYIHESGEELSAGETFVPANKKDPQGFGSALTYCRRYALMTAFGLAAEDDDGHAATQSVRNARRDSDSENAAHEVAASSGNHDDRIDEKQLAMIKQLLDATKTTEGAFLKGMGAPADARLFQLPQSFYAEAVEKLNAKLARMAKEETNAAAAQQSRPPAREPAIAESDIPF